MAPRKRPAFTADERTQLIGWLDLQREIVQWKCAGVSEADAHRAVLPASPNMTMAGLVAHLRWVEQTWFEVMLLDAPAVGPQFDSAVEDADMRVDGIPLAQLLAEYETQWRKSNEIVARHSLDDTGKNRDWAVGQASVRWILLHMIEETARHAGHMDAIRELLDGETGYY
ncbi:DinB family protein [Allokutzneria sp. A3M-2-11 16]|uniref:DinB family protein n=1 Tax=Allokutzneria sp. A3M-2-11 16 TaxID=2962043 RepID=UPI0020B6FC42|nr:DinB family protein [Allokutzneria sp. A3M-2-11 16]MCP3802996.1 DinB family protein [Allokutzneria sp. A3M-2-11 16]